MFDLETKNFDNVGTGFFSSRIEGEPHNITSILFGIRYILVDIISSFGVLIYIFIISYQIGITFIFLSTILFILRYKYTKNWEKGRKKINELHENYSSNFGEIIRGIRDIKALNLRNIIINKTLKEQKEIALAELDIRKKSSFYDVLYLNVSSIITFIIIILGVYLVVNGNIPGGSLLIIYMYKGRIFNFISDLGKLYEFYKSFNISIERLYEVIDGVKYPKEKFGDIDIEKIKGNIEFKNVTFGYNDKKILKNVSFNIKPNSIIGFVGKSGQGKTTIFNLISKLYSVDDGQIFIDGIDINKLSESTIRNNISFITQNPYIFNMSIKDNLKLVNPKITDEEMIEKCKLCALDDFVQTLEKKYDTKVGEGGVILSGGQKQRLAIARALIKNSEIILLDEATSSLDNETQDYIKDSIRKISKDYTVLIIAHRLSTIKNCDKIIVIDDGQIVGIGTHDELIKNNDTYNNLYNKELL